MNIEKFIEASIWFYYRRASIKAGIDGAEREFR